MPQRDPQTYAVIGAAMEVHRYLGPGFLESVYQEALAIEMALRHIPFRREVELPVFYKDRQLQTHFRADFICYDRVIVELKAIRRTGRVEQAQVFNYLKATRYHLGLLLNFGTASLDHKRFIYSR
jgi:GxxExxY protein